MIDRQRVVSLDGSNNLRDLGGYKAEDGRTVRWGALYRSAHLAGLTEAAAAELLALGLRTICDLRHEAERLENRTPAVFTESCRMELLNLHARHEVLINELVSGGPADGLKPRKVMRLIYRSFPLEHASAYAVLLDRAAAPDGVPLLFHCSAGK